MERAPILLGIVGPSGVGKTTLLERLIPALEAKGFSVGAVKHASHGFLADRPGKDSYRLYQAGARAVALASREQVPVFCLSACGLATETELEVALRSLPQDLDVILVEGFAWAPIPRVVLVQEGESPRKEYLTRGSLLCILRVSPPPKGEKPDFPPKVVTRLAEDVVQRMRFRTSLRRGRLDRTQPKNGAFRMTLVIPRRGRS